MGIVLIPHGSGMMRMACAASHDLAAVAAWRIGIRDQEVSTLAGGATPRLAWTSPHCGAGFMPADGVSPSAREPAGAGFGRDKPGPTHRSSPNPASDPVPAAPQNLLLANLFDDRGGGAVFHQPQHLHHAAMGAHDIGAHHALD